MLFETREFSDKLGLEVLGFERPEEIDDEQKRFLRDLFLEAGALLFRGLQMAPQVLGSLSGAFGKAQPYPIPSVRIDGLPEVGVLATNTADLTPTYVQRGIELKYVIPWHADCMFYETPSAGNMLYALQVPDEGGQTGLIDTCQTYEALSDETKREIEGLEIICRFRTSPFFMKFGRDQNLRPPSQQTS